MLSSIEDRVLWLATRMVHEANERPSADGLKVGGHQASCASVVSLLTALYFRWLRPGDLVSVKPHASPVFHAVQYLLGNLDPSYLGTLRAYQGLQAYPSRTKDPDPVDFSTGSVGLGAVAPLFAALAERYVLAHEEAPDAEPRRFVAVIGDAELDEGNIWEAVVEEALAGLGNVTIIVDLNRQSLDRVVPNLRVRRLEAAFKAADWQVLECKYGRRLQAVFARPGGDVLRSVIDAMSNESYQQLIRRSGNEVRGFLTADAPADQRKALTRCLDEVTDADLPGLLADLGGHDLDEIVHALDEADSDADRPAVLFAYTIKGWRLPFAGDALNHSAMLTADQIGELAGELGVDAGSPWARFEPGSAEAQWCEERARVLEVPPRPPAASRGSASGPAPEHIDLPRRATTSTQQAFGDSMSALAREESLERSLVTASPDVSVSTNLGGWINRVGAFSLRAGEELAEEQGVLRWNPNPRGRHVELGISEMNLFMLLSQFGLAAELFGEPLVPVGTVYDPFVCRGLDALIYACYAGARFVVVGTPSGVSLSPEGGAHQSTITVSIGTELPGLRTYEPAFAREVPVCLLEGVRGCLDRADGFSTYLRLSTRPVDQELLEHALARLGPEEHARQVLAGGYRLLESDVLAPHTVGSGLAVQIVASGAVVTEAAQACAALWEEGVAADLVVVTSVERLAHEHHALRRAAATSHAPDAVSHLQTMFPRARRAAPLVTVLDGAPHALSFLGGVFGAPVVPLGVDEFGQSGTIDDLYRHVGIDAQHVVDAALLALDIVAERPGSSDQ